MRAITLDVIAGNFTIRLALNPREFSFAARTVMDESMITEGRYTVGTEVGSILVLAAR